jgi:hypothetical protein
VQSRQPGGKRATSSNWKASLDGGAPVLVDSLQPCCVPNWLASHSTLLLAAREPVLVDLGPLHQVDVSALLMVVATVAGVLVGLLISFIISRQ